MNKMLLFITMIIYNFCTIGMQPAYNQKASLELQEKLNRWHHYNKLKDEEIIELINAGADPNVKGVYAHGQGRTVLIVALMQDVKDNSPIIPFLLAHGADPNINDFTNISPLQHAIIRIKDGTAKYLIEHGANILNVDRHRNTPLFDAVFANRIEVVKLLLEKGAWTDIDKPSIGGETPLFVARDQNRNAELIKLLEWYKKSYMKKKLP
ncbi:hypothetical protein BH09DEP1_BH09DEP1_4910 [soil metagenome]